MLAFPFLIAFFGDVACSCRIFFEGFYLQFAEISSWKQYLDVLIQENPIKRTDHMWNYFGIDRCVQTVYLI